MEPLRTSEINSKYDSNMHSSRVLTIPLIRCDDKRSTMHSSRVPKPLIRCDDQVFNRVMKNNLLIKQTIKMGINYYKQDLCTGSIVQQPQEKNEKCIEIPPLLIIIGNPMDMTRFKIIWIAL